MDVAILFSALSSILFTVSIFWYVRDVAKGRVNVSIGTFIVLSIVTISQLASLIAERVWLVVPFTTIAVVANVLLCLIALRNKRIYFKVMDKFALAGALVGIVVWFVTSDALLNLYVLTVVMVVSVTPMVVKTFKYPNMETRLPWIINLVASLCLLFTITSAAPEAWIVQLRQFLFTLAMNIALRRQSTQHSKN